MNWRAMRSDVAARDGGRDLRAEGHVLGDVEPEVERAGDGHTTVEVLAQVPEDVGVVAAGREDVDEPEQLRLEARMGHRPVEHPLAPPPEVEEVRALGCPGGRDLSRQLLDLVLEALVGHGDSTSSARSRPTSLTMRTADVGLLDSWSNPYA